MGVRDIAERISSNQSAYASNRALADLLPLISAKISEDAPQSPFHHHITPREYIESVKKFKLHDDSTEGQLTYAIVLLTLMQNSTLTKSYACEKIAIPYGVKNSQEIKALLSETLAKVMNQGIDCIESSTGHSSAKSISKEEFNTILSNYKTSYWLLNCIVQIISLGYYNHESHTIKALKKLRENQIITQEMVSKALSQNTSDSQQERRISFWLNNENFDRHSGTDNVLSKLKNKFQNVI